LDWWIFALAGMSVLLISAVAVSWQSWRAATNNPLNALKNGIKDLLLSLEQIHITLL